MCIERRGHFIYRRDTRTRVLSIHHGSVPFSTHPFPLRKGSPLLFARSLPSGPRRTRQYAGARERTRHATHATAERTVLRFHSPVVAFSPKRAALGAALPFPYERGARSLGGSRAPNNRGFVSIVSHRGNPDIPIKVYQRRIACVDPRVIDL